MTSQTTSTWTDEEIQEALTGGDPEWSFAWCINCGSTDTTDFALFQPEGKRELLRVAWCASEPCQADRRVEAGTPVVPVKEIAGGFRVV